MSFISGVLKYDHRKNALPEKVLPQMSVCKHACIKINFSDAGILWLFKALILREKVPVFGGGNAIELTFVHISSSPITCPHLWFS